MSGIKIRNFDPVGELPAPDINGRLVLMESNSNTLALSVVAFVFGCLGVASGGILLNLTHDLVPRDRQTMEITWFIFGLSFLAVTFLCTMLLFPLRLEVDDCGIAVRKLGITGRLAWNDVLEVKLVALPINTNYSTVATETLTEIKGRTKNLSWDGGFPVKPETLADYIRNRAQSNSGHSIISVNDPSSDFVQLAVNNAKAKRLTGKVTFLFLLVCLVLFFLILAIFKILYPQVQL